MIAEIISTGDEILLGDIVDTNASFLCNFLINENISVAGIQAVKDDVQDIKKAINRATEHANICIVTGGLGPTQDDVTALACAKACNQPLKLNSQALDSVIQYITPKGYELTQENKKQAILPACAQIIPNLWGTAPGFYINIKKCLCIFLPGVPGEMKPMFEKTVIPLIKNMPGMEDNKISIRRFTIFGIGECTAGKLLKEFYDKFPDIRLGFRAVFPYLEIKLVKTNSTNIPESAIEFVLKHMQNNVVSLTGNSLESEVGKLLKQKRQTLAIAESCTGGLISSLLTDVPNSSQYFLFGGVTYSNQTKESILNVSADTLKHSGAVHETTAIEMAIGTKKAAKSDWGLSTTGIAGPTGGSDEKPVGTVCIGIAGPNNFTLSKRYEFKFSDRSKNKHMFAATALNLLRCQLI